MWLCLSGGCPGVRLSGCPGVRNNNFSPVRLYSLNLYWAAADMHKCTEAGIACTCTAAWLFQAKCVPRWLEKNPWHSQVAVRRRQAKCHLWPCHKFVPPISLNITNRYFTIFNTSFIYRQIISKIGAIKLKSILELVIKKFVFFFLFKKK